MADCARSLIATLTLASSVVLMSCKTTARDAERQALAERCTTAGACAGAPDIGVGGDVRAEAFAPDKGPAHTLELSASSDGEWRYVSPPNPGRLYDAAYYDDQWFVLHGEKENDLKVTVSEINWLSSTRDGVTWETRTITEQPYESYTRLASNGASLLLAGTRHIAEVTDDGVVRFEALDQSTAPAVLVPRPQGYAIGRQDDVLWMGLDRGITQTHAQPLAQLRVGLYADDRFTLIGPFGGIASPDGQAWAPLQHVPCDGCNLVGLTYGHGRYLAANSETLFTSTDGESWQTHAFEPASDPQDVPPDEADENRIARIDFTAGVFTLHTDAGNVHLSADGLSWSPQLRIPLGQIGPAACKGRCLVSGGRLLLPPPVVPKPVPPPGADTRSAYYCEFGALAPDRCLDCGGATVASCKEGVICRQRCSDDKDCPAPDTGSARPVCSQTQLGGECFLYCDAGESCPNGMTCSGGICLYVFDDPRCL